MRKCRDDNLCNKLKFNLNKIALVAERRRKQNDDIEVNQAVHAKIIQVDIKSITDGKNIAR